MSAGPAVQTKFSSFTTGDTSGDLARFGAAAAKLAFQYDAYRRFPDVAVNCKQTLAENIANVAGITPSNDGTGLRSTASELV